MMTKLPWALLLLLLPWLAACQANETRAPIATNPPVTPAPVVSPAALATASPAAMNVQAVEVRMVEYKFQMPETLPAGPTTFRVINAGSMPHNFEIEGQGIEKKFDQPLPPGETKTIQVDLKPGSYTVYCPVANHAERGMKMTLNVTQ